MLTKSTIDLQLFSGSNYWRFGDVMTPISQNAGFSLTYHSGMQNNVGNFPSHGSSATPTHDSILYRALRRSAASTRGSAARRCAPATRGYLTFAVDNTAQWMYGTAPDNIQWFDSVSYSYQIRSQSRRSRSACARSSACRRSPTAAATAKARARTSRSPITCVCAAIRILSRLRRSEHAHHGPASDLQSHFLRGRDRRGRKQTMRLIAAEVVQRETGLRSAALSSDSVSACSVQQLPLSEQ